MRKKKTRLYYTGQATFRLVIPERSRGYGWMRATWRCIDCGARYYNGTNDNPYAADSACARNGHAPCRICGTLLARLNDGCAREHAWNRCPGKTEDDRCNPQHAHKGHLERVGGGQ